jgi:hypothetical protein
MQRPSKVSSPSISMSVSSEANSVSDLMSTRQPVRRAARRAFWPSDDHGRLALLVVDDHLAHPRR